MSDPSASAQWTVSSLHIYPIKSCRGLDLSAVRFDALGPLYDRRFMLVDEAGRCLTQRELPRMALIAPRLGAMDLSVSAPDMPLLKLAMAGRDSKVIEAQVWGSQVQAEDAGEQAASWFGQFLQRRCRLVRFASGTSLRFADAKYAGEDVEVAFADGFPVLLANEASLADLNARMKQAVGMNRFRPNIVVKGGAAFAEDRWKQIRIGDVGFDVVKPCSRCKVVTVDPILASTGPEPLATLATYRATEHKVMFGQNCVHRALGSIRVGDPLIIEVEA